METIKDDRYPGLTITSPDIDGHSDAASAGLPVSGMIVPHIRTHGGRAQPGFNPNRSGRVIIDPGENSLEVDLGVLSVDELNKAAAAGVGGLAAIRQAMAQPIATLTTPLPAPTATRPAPAPPDGQFVAGSSRAEPSNQQDTSPAPSTPEQVVLFDIPEAGELEVRYHVVHVSDDGPSPSILLAYDTRFKYGVRYFPPFSQKPVAVRLPDGRLYLVGSYGIRNLLWPFELCVLLIERQHTAAAAVAG